MTNSQQYKLDTDLETVRLLYAVHEAAYVMIAQKNSIGVPVMHSTANKFAAPMCLISVLSLPLEDKLDLAIAGLVVTSPPNLRP